MNGPLRSAVEAASKHSSSSLGGGRRPLVVGCDARAHRVGLRAEGPRARRDVRAGVAVGKELIGGGPKGSPSGGGGGGAGAGGIPPSPRITAEDDGEGMFGDQNSIVDLLMKAGASISDLPLDLQVALREGLLTLQDIQQWLALAATPILGAACKALPAVRDRVMGNPRFLIQVMMELALGLAAKTSAEINARGDKFMKEMPFVLSDVALEALGDISMVWLLSPRKSFKPLPGKGLPRRIAKLPGHWLQAGNFTLAERAATVLYRGLQFFAVGFTTSAIGHSFTKWAVESSVENAEEMPHLAPVLDNSIGWGSFMALSSNLRYQFVNGFEERLLDVFVPNKALNSLGALGVRYSNCYLGGVQWVWFARMAGLQ